MMQYAAYIFVLLVTLIFPLCAMIYFAARKDGSLRAFLAGMAAFTVSQIFIRLPLLQILAAWDSFSLFMALRPVVYYIFMGMTAGLFEGTARNLGMRLICPKQRQWLDGVAFGLGHGGIEALLLVGIGYSLQPTIVLAAAAPSLMVMAGVERLSAIALHLGLSVLVMRGLTLGQKWHVWAAIGIHGLVDSSLGFMAAANWPMWGIEAAIAAVGIAMLVYTIAIKSKWRVQKHET